MAKFSLFENLSEFDDSLMRSVLLFGFRSTTTGKRANQYRRAILSIVIYGKGNYDVKNITEIFNKNFHLNQDEQDIQQQLNYLTRDNFITKTPDEKYVAKDEDGRGERFFNLLENDTKALLNRIVTKVNAKYPMNSSQKAIVAGNAKNALSMFLQI